MSAGNLTKESNDIVFWALNGYGVTAYDLVVNGLIVLLGAAIVALNSLVLDTMIRFKESVEPTEVMLCSLAIADLVTGLSMFHLASYNIVNYQIYLECMIRNGFTFCLVTSSVLHLTCLTCDRYIKIMFPYRYDEMCRMRTVALLSALLWVMSIIVAITPFLGWSYKEMHAYRLLYTVVPDQNPPECSFFGHLHPDFASFLVTLFLMSYFIMGLLYLHIFKWDIVCIRRNHGIRGYKIKMKQDRDDTRSR